MEFPVNSISDLEKLSHAVKWQYFEKLTAFIFEKNDFEAEQNTVIKTGSSKRQFDVIAKKYGTTWLVECKKWKGRTEKTATLKSAVKKHMERCDMYAIKTGETIRPVVVTLLDDSIEEHEGVPIIPILKLNWFLNDML
ncbi:MAG: restriction endonuclease [Candidatus Aenigmarchaeota archaeon]|nr:restriction endonuclease [Candidatus Aenigmarchaeota archaeon]